MSTAVICNVHVKTTTIPVDTGVSGFSWPDTSKNNNAIPIKSVKSSTGMINLTADDYSDAMLLWLVSDKGTGYI